MVDFILKGGKRLRLYVQIVFLIITNGYAKGFAQGSIYKGDSKTICLPGLNCYSCPGSLGACPIGALQAVINSRNYSVSYYMLGFFFAVGAIFGRFVCGWLCPFGLFQDLLYKIPFGKKILKIKGEKYLKMAKYFMLIIFVIILPMLVLDIMGQGSPWFCEFICPSGTLMAGWPLVILNEGIRKSIGILFAWKSAILVFLIIASVFIYRPFCRFLCPLGAIYGFFNPISIYKYKVDNEKCTNCMACQKACKINIKANIKPNSMECIRCGECLKACEFNALTKVSLDVKRKNDIINEASE